jgi:hypothetical protein
MVTTATADNALKNYYLSAVSDILNTGVDPFFARIKQSTADVVGKDVRKLVRYGVNGGIGAGTETGSLPAAKGNNYALFVSTLKNLFGTIEISDKAIRASANNEGAFVNLLNDEMDGLIRSSSYNFGRMLFGDGSGTLAKTTGVTDGVISLDSIRNVAEGMAVDFYSTSGSVVSTSRAITKVDRINKTITVDGSKLTANNLPAGSSVILQGSKGLELTGLGALFSNSDTLYGVTRAEHDWMMPYMNTEFGDITETKLQTAIDFIEESSGGHINFIVCSWGVKRALAAYLSEKKTNVDVMNLQGGYTALSFNGIPVVAERFCPSGTMYLLNTDDFCLHQLCDWQWLEGEDGKILKQVAGKPVYKATLVKYADLLCCRPNGQAMLSGITEA